MRTWELVLVVADLVAFCVAVVPRLRARVRPLVAVAPVAAGLQVLVEGPRWQLVPAYLAAALFSVIPTIAAGRRRESGQGPVPGEQPTAKWEPRYDGGPTSRRETGTGGGPTSGRETRAGGEPTPNRESGAGGGPTSGRESGAGGGPTPNRETGSGEGPSSSWESRSGERQTASAETGSDERPTIGRGTGAGGAQTPSRGRGWGRGRRGFGRRWVVRGGAVLATAVGAVLLVASAAVPVAVPVFRFPEPSGPYGIGTTTYHWADVARPELFTADPGDHRELMAQVWYPAANGATGQPVANGATVRPAANAATGRPAAYIDDAADVTPEMARLFGFPEWTFGHFRYVTTNARQDVPAAPGRHPVLIFLSGLNGFRSVSTFQIEELVSRGYIVVGLDQPGAVAAVRLPDGRTIPGLPRASIQPLIDQSLTPRPTPPSLHGTPLPAGIVPYFAGDVTLTLDRLAALHNADPHRLLTGRLDLTRAAAFGISLGGMTAAQACKDEPRLRACLIMDVELPADVMAEGLRRPAMFITRDAATMRLERARFGGWSEEEIRRTLGTMRTAFEDVAGPGYHLTIPGMFHLNFTDLPYWSPLAARLGLTGPIPAERGFAVVNAYSVAFFDRHLRGRAEPLLDGPDPRFPDVRLEVSRSGA